MASFVVGDTQVTLIKEMSLLTSGTAMTAFTDCKREAVEAYGEWLMPDHVDAETMRLRMSFHSWLLRDGKRNVLIDTCCGNHKPRPGKPTFDNLNTPFMDNLKAAGVEPEEIDFVMCTHLHVDHVGWNTRLENGVWVPTFPNARYVMSKTELDFWSDRAVSEETPAADRFVYNDSVLPIVEAGMAVTVDGEDEVAGLSLVPAPGHTPGHVRIDLESRDKRAMFIGDILHNPLQVPLWRCNSNFCEDIAQAIETRLVTLETCADRGDYMFPAHFAAPHVCRIERQKNTFVPIFCEEVI